MYAPGMTSGRTERVLITGATGFVGSYLYPALVAAGYRVRCASRRPTRAEQRYPEREWIGLDIDDPASIAPAMDGCDAAFFLVHEMAHGSDYPEREQRGAAAFLAAAERVGLRRIVYLGGVQPRGKDISRHLRSRRQTGEILRAGRVSTIELRAAMIIGEGSVSWTMVRDLAARLPAMLLPRWLRNASYPVFIDDVVGGLIDALGLPGDQSAYYELPGPERVTHKQMLERTAAAMGHTRIMVGIPVLTPRLSSYWIGLITRVDMAVARELVEGVRYDLEPTGRRLWDVTGRSPTPLDQAIALALEDHTRVELPCRAAERRLVQLGQARVQAA